MRLSILRRIMEIEEGVMIALSEISIILHNYDTIAEYNNCFIIHSK